MNFMQEGIGALCAYMPTHLAIKTLNDMLAILEPSIKQKEEGRPKSIAPIISPIEAVVVPVAA